MSEHIRVEVTRNRPLLRKRDEFRFVVVEATNGNPLAKSTEGYFNHGEMLAAVESVVGGTVDRDVNGRPLEPLVVLRGGAKPPVPVVGATTRGRGGGRR